MMNPRSFAFAGGFLMLALGVLALIPVFSVSSASLPALEVDWSYGLFLGIFPMNIYNKIALIAFGIYGITAASAKRGIESSILYSRVVFYVMGTLAVLGMFHSTNTLFGYWPLFGAEVWAHGIFAILGGVFGYAYLFKKPRHTAAHGV